MKRVVVFILIILHLNAALIPQLNEVDSVDASTGQQLEDINSVIEWVRAALGYDTIADDEDDDSGDNGQICSNYISIPHQTVNYADLFAVNAPPLTNKGKFADLYQIKLQLIHFEIVAPPPEV